MTANEFFIRYQDYEKKTKKTGTIMSRLSLIRCHLLKAYGDYELADICESSMILLKNKMQAAGLKEGTINTAFSAFSCFFKLAMNENLISSSPVGFASPSRSAKSPLEKEKALTAQIKSSPKQPRYFLKQETAAQKNEVPAALPCPIARTGPNAPFLTSCSPFEVVARHCIREFSKHSAVPENYHRKYISVLEKYVFRKIGSKAIISVLESDIEALISDDNMPAHIGFQRYKMFLMINRVFRYSLEHNLILFNPCANVRCVHRQLYKPYREFSPYECDALLNAFKAVCFGPLISFSFATGLPVPEALMLSRNNVDLNSGRAVINQRMVLNGPHDSFPRPVKERSIFLPEEGKRILRNIHIPPGESFFFYAEKEIASTAALNMDLQKIRSLSGIPDFEYRDLTENFIMHCLNANVDIASLENYIGYRAGSIITRIHVNTLGILPDSIWAGCRKKRR